MGGRRRYPGERSREYAHNVHPLVGPKTSVFVLTSGRDDGAVLAQTLHAQRGTAGERQLLRRDLGKQRRWLLRHGEAADGTQTKPNTTPNMSWGCTRFQHDGSPCHLASAPPAIDLLRSCCIFYRAVYRDDVLLSVCEFLRKRRTFSTSSSRVGWGQEPTSFTTTTASPSCAGANQSFRTSCFRVEVFW